MTTIKHSILVVGSSNTDMVIKTDRFPLPGETILGGKFLMAHGGKGANQAVAAARLGGHVTFIGKIGKDIFGQQAMQQFRKEGINIDFILFDADNPSGIALITVDSKGENTIVVAQGANAALMPDDIKKAEHELLKNDFILMQLEIPLQTVQFVARAGSAAGKKVILNPAPAPASPLPDELLKNIYIITPNKAEAEALSGIKISDLQSAGRAAKWLLDKGVANVIITLGAQGAFICNADVSRHLSTPVVDAVDTTAAGDVFNGALAVALSENKAIDEAVDFANRSAAVSVTRMGAQASAPYRNEILKP